MRTSKEQLGYFRTPLAAGMISGVLAGAFSSIGRGLLMGGGYPPPSAAGVCAQRCTRLAGLC
ncbi:MAG TPA: hypothetical protein VGP72_09920 [Planctomycetota bacterium]